MVAAASLKIVCPSFIFLSEGIFQEEDYRSIGKKSVEKSQLLVLRGCHTSSTSLIAHLLCVSIVVCFDLQILRNQSDVSVDLDRVNRSRTICNLQRRRLDFPYSRSCLL